MSLKRKLEEYHDPDYPQENLSKLPKIKTSPSNSNDLEKQEKIVSIIDREFGKEMSSKEQEIYEINSRITLAKKMLHKVCFAVITSYYNNKNLLLSGDEVIQTNSKLSQLFTNESKGVQNAIHPSLKKLLGMNELDYKALLNLRPIRQAAKAAQSTIKEKCKSKKDRRIERLKLKSLHSMEVNTTIDHSGNDLKHERLLPSTSSSRWDKPISKLNANRGVNFSRQLVAVGNTSKFIGNEESLNNVTHKWLIYVQSRTNYPIEKFIRKIRFYLHPSYKPNDIVDVDFPPFQIARRGWGEFPVRIQLFFHPKFKQKPVQLVHSVVLDKTLTGLQTMGSETLVEIWLRPNFFSPLKYTETVVRESENFDKVHDNAMKNLNKKYFSSNKLTSPNRDNFMAFIEQIESPSISADVDNIVPTLILSPTTNKTLRISEVINSPISNNNILTPIKSKTDPHKIKAEQLNFEEVSTEDFVIKEPDIYNTVNRFNQIEKDSFSKISHKIKAEEPDLYNSINTLNMTDNNYTYLRSKPTKLPTNIKNANNKLKQTIGCEYEQLNELTNISKMDKSVFKTDNPLYSNEIDKLTSIKYVNSDSNSDHTIIHKSNANTSNSHIILKDGKVSIIDPLQTKLKLKRKNQISLLKPMKITQIKRNNQNRAYPQPWLIDHTYTIPCSTNTNCHPVKHISESDNLRKSPMSPERWSTVQSTEIIRNAKTQDFSEVQNSLIKKTEDLYTVETSSMECLNSESSNSFQLQDSNFISIVLPNNTTKFVNLEKKISFTVKDPTILMQKPQIDYCGEFKLKFYSQNFITEEHLVRYLFEELPLINLKGSDNQYKQAFPFVVENLNRFEMSLLPKRRALEWLQCKYFSQLMGKHHQFSNMAWSTKEIILYGRTHSYIPTYFICNKMENKPKNVIFIESIDPSTSESKSIEKIYGWIKEAEKNLDNEFLNNEKINVEEVTEEEQKILKETVSKSQNKYENSKVVIPIEEEYKEEIRLITDMCFKIGIKLKPEEIAPGKLCHATNVILSKVLRRFLEDLIRKSSFERNRFEPECAPFIQSQHIKQAILTNPELDFLTNRIFNNFVKEEREIDN